MAGSFSEDWNGWRERRFPPEVMESDLGFDLATIDSFAAGCLETFAERGTLDDERIGVLERCLQDLHPLLGQVPERAGNYFAELADLCRRVLGAVGRRN